VYLIQQNAPNANALTAYTAVKRDLQMHRIWRFRQLFCIPFQRDVNHVRLRRHANYSPVHLHIPSAIAPFNNNHLYSPVHGR